MGRVHVVEMSSYQIDLAPSLDPSVGILLNVSEDHIDRHGTLEHYAAVKARLVAGVQPQGTSIVGVDDGWCRNIADRLDQAGKRVVRISVKNPLPDGSMSSAKPLFAPPAAHAAKSQSSAASARCAACTMRRTRPAPRPARWRWVSPPTSCKTACAVFRGWRTAWSRSAAAATCCSSTTPRAPMPMQPRMRCRHSLTSSGSPAESRRLGGITSLTEYFPRIRKAYLIGEAAAEFSGTLGTRVPHEIVADARCRRRQRRARRGSLRPRRRGRAAVAGLRLVRPVPQFRNPRDQVPRSGRRRCRV